MSSLGHSEATMRMELIDTQFARAALRDDLANQQRELATSVLKLNPADNDVQSLLNYWESFYGPAIKRTRHLTLRCSARRDGLAISKNKRRIATQYGFKVKWPSGLKSNGAPELLRSLVMK